MKNKLKTVALTIILFGLIGCGSSDDSSTSETSSDNGDKSGAYKAIAPLRYLTENYQTLSSKEVATILSNLSQDDKTSLSYYEAFSSMVHYKACQADSSVLVTLVTKGAYSCQENIANYNQGIQYGFYTPETAFSAGESEAEKILVAIKCNSGEIDASTCSLYNNILQGWSESNSNLYQNMLNSNFSRQLAEQCNSDGQLLSSGAMCVLK